MLCFCHTAGEDEIIVIINFITGKISEKVRVIQIAVNQGCRDRAFTSEGRKKNAEECGQVCYLWGTVMTYGRGKYCDSSGCNCSCFKTQVEGKCQQTDDSNSDIYQVIGELYYIKKL